MAQFKTLTAVVLCGMFVLLCSSASGAPVLWLDADQFGAAQANLATWTDQSPAGNDVSLVLGDGPAVVLGGLNAKPVVRFTADAMVTPGAVSFETVFVVLNNTQGANFPNWNTAIGSTGCCDYIVQGSMGSSNLDTAYDSPDGTFFVNGAASTSFGPLATHKLVTKTLSSTANQQVRIGWDRNIGGRNWDGDFAEVILFPGALTGDETTGINSILATKWGLPPIAASPAQIAAGNAALGIGPPPPPATIPTPTAYYPFNEGVGTTTADLAGGSNGTLNGGTIGWTAGRTGGAGDFAVDLKNTNDGNRVNVLTNAFAGAAAANNQMSFSFWQYNPGGGAANESSFWAVSPTAGGGARGAQAHVPWSNGNVYWDTAGCCGGGTERINALSPPGNYDANWHHWAFVKDGNSKQIWVDGGLLHSGNNTDPLLPFSQLVIGAELQQSSGNAINSFSGYIDDFAVFDVALTPAEIGLLAGGGAVPVPAPVILGPNLVTDGSFEVNTNGNPGTGANSELGAHNYAGSTWGNSDVTTHWDKNDRTWYVTDGGDAEFPDGDFAYRIDARLDIGGADYLWQDGIALTAGQEYQFSFEMWGESGNPILDATLTGPDAIVLFDDTRAVANDNEAVTKSILFTPSVTGSYRLNFFTDVQNGDSHAWVDDVSIRAAYTGDIPEPATLVLAGLAIAALGGYVKKRRTATKTLALLAAAGLVVLAGGNVQANIVIDGSFEDVSSTAVGTGQASELGAHNYLGSTWGNTDILNQWDKVQSRTWIMTDGVDNEFPDGAVAVRLDGQDKYNARLFQPGIAMEAYKEYELSVSMWGEGGSPGIGAQFVGQTSGDVVHAFYGPTTNGTDGVAEVKTAKFVPTSTEDYTIELYATNSQHTWIDDVSVEATGVTFPALGPNLVMDGSFEVNTNPNPGTGANSELGAHNYAGSTWGDSDVTTHWDKHDRIWYVTDGGDAEFPDGAFAYVVDASLDHNGIDRLWQDGIALEAGTEYLFSFDMWGQGGNPILDATLTGPDNIVLFDNTTTIGNDGMPERKSLLFTPSVTGSYRLDFFTDVHSHNHTWIDDVRLSAVLADTGDIPEPATMALVGLAVAGLGGYLRRRRKA